MRHGRGHGEAMAGERRRGVARQGGGLAVWRGRGGAATRWRRLQSVGFLAAKTLGQDHRGKFGASLQDLVNLLRVYGICWRVFFAPSSTEQQFF